MARPVVRKLQTWQGAIMHIARIISTILVLIAGVALAQPDTAGEATRSATYRVSHVDGSGVSGTVFVGEYGPGTTIVVVSLAGTSAGDTHPVHFHRGDCGSGGGIEVPLSAVDGATGMSVTLTDASYMSIVESDHYLNVHRSPDQIESIVACGELGTGVEPVRETSQRVADAGDAPDESAATDPSMDAPESNSASADRSATPSTASYGLFPVQGSDIRGQVQLTELPGQGTKFVVSLVGIETGRDFGLALYEGDCGPDRPKVRDLEPVGEREDDPYVSITDTTLPFATITEGDYFLYVFDGRDGVEVAACGEVGAGANR